MDRRKPSTTDAGRQHSYAGIQRSLPAEDATAELWQVTIKWVRATGGTVTDDKMQTNVHDCPE